jgi:hypothetical protein
MCINVRAFENSVLMRILGLKTDELAGGCMKLHNEELHELYTSPSIIRMITSKGMRWAGHVARLGRRGDACRLLVGKPEGEETCRKTNM